MPSKDELCQQCGAILKTSVCLKCGYDSTDVEEILSAEESSGADDQQETVKVTPEKIESHEQVQSIFNDIATASGVAEDVPEAKPTVPRYLAPVFLSLILFALAGLSYWRFIYFTPEYISPLVLSASDIKAVDGAVESTASAAAANSDTEKTIDLESRLEAGNFAVGNFAQFGASNTKVLVQAFDIKNVFAKFKKEDVIKEIQEEYKISDDDFDVYFSKGFAYFIPGDNLDTWGFAIGVNDKSYVQKRLEEFKDKKENEKYEFAKYSVSLVEAKKETFDIEESTSSAEDSDDQDADTAKSDEEDKKDVSKEEDTEKDTTEGDLYLLISNSNEYLDQMRESAEGNLTNLSNEIVYANSKADLPQLGEVLLYKRENAEVWPMLIEIVSDKYSYVGLDKVLETIKSTGAAFYSVDSKLRISMSED